MYVIVKVLAKLDQLDKISESLHIRQLVASLGRLYDPSIEGVFLFFFNVLLFSHDLLIDYYSVLNVHVSIKQFLQFPIPIGGG